MGIHQSPTKNITLSQSVWVSMRFSFSWNTRNIRKKSLNLYSVGQHFSCIHLMFLLSLQSEYINKDNGKKAYFPPQTTTSTRIRSYSHKFLVSWCIIIFKVTGYIWVHIWLWVPHVAFQFEWWLQTAMDVSTFTVLCFCTTTASLRHAYVVGTWVPPTQSIFIW